MIDMLVRLYDIPGYSSLSNELTSLGIEIRKALAFEKHIVLKWVAEKFMTQWSNECDVAFSRSPISCLLAIENGKIIGFACYETTYKGFFGPTGVVESARGRGVGKALLLQSLHSLAELGYAYAIIGGVGPVEYYEKVVGAVKIEGSTPGIYKGALWE